MLQISVKVVPNAKEQRCFLDKNGTIKCYIKSLPEKGMANKELITFLAKKLSVAQKDIFIFMGMARKVKILSINSLMTYDQLLHKLGCVVQSAIV